jgi:hypothetical protein
VVVFPSEQESPSASPIRCKDAAGSDEGHHNFFSSILDNVNTVFIFIITVHSRIEESANLRKQQNADFLE